MTLYNMREPGGLDVLCLNWEMEFTQADATWRSRQERLILADATQKFERLLITRIFATDIAAFAELASIARALWSGTLRGQALTAQHIAHTIGMPRTTGLRKLQYMLKHGYVTQDVARTSLALRRSKQQLQR